MFGKKRKQVASMMPLPPKLLIGIVVVCAVAAIFLLPNQETLLDRQLRDEDWSKALTTLRGLPPTERVARQQYYDLLELRLRRLSLAPDDREGFTTTLVHAVKVAATYEFTPDYVKEIELLAARSLSARETHRILSPYLDKLPATVRDQLRESLAKRALAEAEPILALEIYQEYWRWHPADPEVVFHYINLARGAGKPRHALYALDHYEKQLKEPLFKSNRQLAILKIRLLRESNQQDLAFREMRRFYDAADDETRRELYSLLNETAVQSGNALALLDEMHRLAEAAPNDAPRWRELAKLAMAANRLELAGQALEHVVKIAPRDGESAFKLAQMYEWSNRPNDAFDMHLRALDLGVDESLNRLLALNPGLYRDVEMAAAIRKASGKIDLEKHGLQMARLFANLNDFDRARTYYTDRIRRGGEDAALLAEYAQMELDLGNLEAALALYSRAAKADPADADLGISIAEAQFRAGQFDAALQTYKDLLQRHPTRNQLGNYLRLAESMGRIEDAAGVLRRFMQDFGDADRKDYEKLTYFYSILGWRDKMEPLLEETVRLFPDDDRARRQLLYAYNDNHKTEKATEVLATFPGLATDTELTKFYINLLNDAKRYAEVERFIEDQLTPETVEQLKLNQLLASIYYETGNTNAARELYGKLHRADPGNTDVAMTYIQFLLDADQRPEAKRVLRALPDHDAPRALKMAAQLHAADREFEEALRFQQKYLASDPADAGRDWGFLGDLLGEKGDRSAAQSAYRRAIKEMLATISKIPQTNGTHVPFTAN